MFMCQSDLNFKEIWASLLGKKGTRRKEQENENKKTEVFRGDDKGEEMKRWREREGDIVMC